MEPKIIIYFLCMHSINAMSTVNNEFNRNTFDDESEYSIIDTNYLKENEPKSHFFRQVRSFEEDYKNVEMIDTMEEYGDIPKSRYFRDYYELNSRYPPYDMHDDNFNINDKVRNKRSLKINRVKRNDAKNDRGDEIFLISKPLEIGILDIENTTQANSGEFKEENELNSDTDVVTINDFIRFKRDLDFLNDKNDTDVNDDEDKYRPKREKEEAQTTNESRSPSKEHWVKQPYPVGNRHLNTYDNSVSSSDTSRAPRVNFVTQRRSESVPPPVYRVYENDVRGREINGDIVRDEHEYPSEYERKHFRVPRYYKSYSQSYYPHDYYRDEYRRGRPLYESDYKYYQPERPIYNKQKRIIYYATLPEVVRTPPNVDLRDMYRYRDPYDNVYTGHRDDSVGDSYIDSKPYPITKSRYDENLHGKTPYPLKVSTDLNVREINKNPERRIYSESDRRYPYRLPPYQTDEVPYGRHI